MKSKKDVKSCDDCELCKHDCVLINNLMAGAELYGVFADSDFIKKLKIFVYKNCPIRKEKWKNRGSK